MGFVAYPVSQRNELQSYVYLSDDGRWNDLGDAFEKEARSLYGLQEASMVTHTLQTGISALKTVFCTDAQPKSKEANEKEVRMKVNGDCPTCDPKMLALGKELPCAHLAQTSIACRVTG